MMAKEIEESQEMDESRKSRKAKAKLAEVTGELSDLERQQQQAAGQDQDQKESKPKSSISDTVQKLPKTLQRGLFAVSLLIINPVAFIIAAALYAGYKTLEARGKQTTKQSKRNFSQIKEDKLNELREKIESLQNELNDGKDASKDKAEEQEQNEGQNKGKEEKLGEGQNEGKEEGSDINLDEGESLVADLKEQPEVAEELKYEPTPEEIENAVTELKEGEELDEEIENAVSELTEDQISDLSETDEKSLNEPMGFEWDGDLDKKITREEYSQWPGDEEENRSTNDLESEINDEQDPSVTESQEREVDAKATLKEEQEQNEGPADLQDEIDELMKEMDEITKDYTSEEGSDLSSEASSDLSSETYDIKGAITPLDEHGEELDEEIENAVSELTEDQIYDLSEADEKSLNELMGFEWDGDLDKKITREEYSQWPGDEEENRSTNDLGSEITDEQDASVTESQVREVDVKATLTEEQAAEMEGKINELAAKHELSESEVEALRSNAEEFLKQEGVVKTEEAAAEEVEEKIEEIDISNTVVPAQSPDAAAEQAKIDDLMQEIDSLAPQGQIDLAKETAPELGSQEKSKDAQGIKGKVAELVKKGLDKVKDEKSQNKAKNGAKKAVEIGVKSGIAGKGNPVKTAAEAVKLTAQEVKIQVENAAKNAPEMSASDAKKTENTTGRLAGLMTPMNKEIGEKLKAKGRKATASMAKESALTVGSALAGLVKNDQKKARGRRM